MWTTIFLKKTFFVPKLFFNGFDPKLIGPKKLLFQKLFDQNFWPRFFGHIFFYQKYFGHTFFLTKTTTLTPTTTTT